MTSLPIIWGEGSSMQDILSGKSEPAAIYRHWQSKYKMEAVDSLEGLEAGSTDIVMLVQPRPMAPADLADLDQWVRAGGRVLVMTDPDLVWPSTLPLGDPQRPLSIGLLSPLLGHWGLELTSEEEDVAALEIAFADYRLATVGVGRFEPVEGKKSENANCRFGDQNWIAHCEVGKGKAILVADADFLNDQLWSEDRAGEGGEQSDAIRFTDALIREIGTGGEKQE